jgi:hypothetical protein
MLLQGQLFTAGGEPMAGPVELTVSVYATQGSATALYTDVIANVPLTESRFAVAFGAHPLVPAGPSLATVIAQNPVAWVGIRVDGGPEVSRQQLLSVPFAMAAERAAAADDLTMTCDLGHGLRYGAAGWECAAPEVACSGCVDGVDIAPNSINATHIQNGSIAAADVAFNYAGSDSKGGAATDLDCGTPGCVSGADIAANAALRGRCASARSR